MSLFLFNMADRTYNYKKASGERKIRKEMFSLFSVKLLGILG